MPIKSNIEIKIIASPTFYNGHIIISAVYSYKPIATYFSVVFAS